MIATSAAPGGVRGGPVTAPPPASRAAPGRRPPGAEYYVIVLAGLAVSLGIIASTFPVLDRITGPETARNE
jgi:hypothetical protein